MMPTLVLDFVSLFFAGLLAGAEVVIQHGLRAPVEVLDDRSQIRLRQALIMRLRVLVPALFASTAVSGVAVTVLGATGPGLWFRLGGLLAVLTWTLTRVVGTVRLNSDTIDWQPDAPPANWRALVHHAERFHTVGVWAAVVAFASFLTAVALAVH